MRVKYSVEAVLESLYVYLGGFSFDEVLKLNRGAIEQLLVRDLGLDNKGLEKFWGEVREATVARFGMESF